MYVYTNQLADRGVKHLEKKNITYSKDGLKVGVKSVNDEDINDKSQRYVCACDDTAAKRIWANMRFRSVLVKAWNLASFPGYKSKLWNTEATPNFQRTPSDSKVKTSSSGSSRPSASRTSTGVSTKSQH